MRVVFMGTPEIAATCLRALCAQDFSVVGVYTKPDMPKNRGHKLMMSEVKEYALAQGLPVFQPTGFRDDAVYEELKALKPDVLAVVAYGKILPQRVLDIPRLGAVNMHASILPSLRGSGPVQWSILNGDTETGVTAMYMAAEMDAGDIIEIRKTPIDPEETAGELMGRLAEIAAGLLCDTLHSMQNGTVTRTPQQHEKATYAPMLSKALCPINWKKTRREIINQVRGLNPWPIATAEICGQRFKIYGVKDAERTTDKAPGTLLALTKAGLEVACADGVLTITRLQTEGGKAMAAADYFRGHPIEISQS